MARAFGGGAVVVGGARDDEAVQAARLVEVLDRAEAVVDPVDAVGLGVEPRRPSASTSACDRTIWPPLPAAAIRAA